MKKYRYAAIGFIVGISVALGGTALAEGVSKIGKSIKSEFVVKINGEELPLKALGVDGSSYGPIRPIAEAAGFEVDFKDGVVLLTTPEEKEGEVVETTFEGLKSVSVGGEIYFSAKSYNDTNDRILWGFRSEDGVTFLGEFTPGNAEVVNVILEVGDKNDLFTHQGSTYINSKYYRSVEELQASN